MKERQFCSSDSVTSITSFYYINTSEIPSELSRKNFISSYVKITCYPHMRRDHRRYGYIINSQYTFSFVKERQFRSSDTVTSITSVYYITTIEILSGLFRENFISSHVKITCYLHMRRDHRRYGYIINRAFESKPIWYFTGVYIINRILHTRLWIWILSCRFQLHISRVSSAHSWDIELTTWR